MIKCEECKGRGWKPRTVREGNLLLPVKIWCEKCQGRGEYTYDGDRTKMEGE